MKNKLLLTITFLACALGLYAQAPIISSFSPSSGAVGTTVTITGTNFDPAPANNNVYFGATRATVAAATTTQLTVTVPTGATYQPITVQVAGLTGFSSKPFVVTFAGGGSIDACSFAPRIDYATIGVNPGMEGAGAIADIDGDGKSDVLVSNRENKHFSIYRNVATSGSISLGSFAPKLDFVTGTGGGVGPGPTSIDVGDVDGDGKRDVVVMNYSLGTISVFRNTSTAGNISLQPKVDFPIGSFTWVVKLFDIDSDGKLDIVMTSFFEGVSILRNTSTIGFIDATSFANRVSFPTGSNPASFSIGDLDGDGKSDIAVPNQQSNSLSILRNTSTTGSVTLAPQVTFSTGNLPGEVALSDFDGDGKFDLAVPNQGSSFSITIFRNTSSVGSFSFSSFEYSTPALAHYLASLGDIDGDGKTDLAVANVSANSVSLLKNTSILGNISFTPSIVFPLNSAATARAFDIHIADIDGDGKNDLTSTNYGFSVLRNVIGEIPLPTITSFTPSSGPIGTSVTITGTNFSTLLSNSIKINGVSATITASTATSLTVTVPVGATTGPFELTIGCNTVTSTGSFTVIPYVPFGNTVQLNGTSDYITTSVDVDPTAMPSTTWEAWVYPTNVTSYRQTIFTNDDGGFDRAVIIQSGINFGIFVGTGPWEPVAITPNQWQHIAVVYTPSNVFFYKDGVQYTYGSAPATGPTNNFFTIGANLCCGEFFTGKIDEVRVWNVARTQSEIQSTINRTLAGNEVGLVAYYKLDEPGQGADITVANSATATGASLDGATVGSATTPVFTGTAINPTPPSGNSITLNGSTDYVSIPDNTALKPASVTVEAYVRVNAFTSTKTGGNGTAQYLLHKQNSRSTNFEGYTLALDEVNKAFVGVASSATGVSSFQVTPNNSIVLGQWYHLALTINSTELRFYVNGVQQGAAVPTGFSLDYGTNPVFIGRTGDVSFEGFLNGQVDEARIWNTVRTQSEIQSTISTTLVGNEPGLVAYYKLDETGQGDDIPIINSATATGASLNGVTVGTATTPVFTAGTITANNSIKFNGSNQEAQLGTWFNYQNFTISMWVKPGASQTTYADIIDNNHSGGRSFVLQQDFASTNQYTFGGDANAFSNAALLFNLSADVWQHVTLVSSATQKSVYVNGMLAASVANSTPITYDGTQSLRLANWDGGGRNWNGEMDEVKIYNRAFTASEVLASVYSPESPLAANLQAYYKMDETSGSIIYDSSPNGRNGTLINSPSFQTSGVPTAAVMPANGLKLWLRADDIALPDNSLLSSWSDASGNSNSFTASGLAQPTFRINGNPSLLNGKPYINFNALNSLSRNDVLGMAANTPRTFIAVYKLTDPANRCFAIQQGNFSTAGTYFGIDANTFQTAGNFFGVYATNNSIDSNVPTDTKYHVQFLQASSMSVGANVINDLSYRIDDNLTSLVTRVGAGTYESFASANEMRLSGQMDFAEIIAYDRVLTNSERATVTAYLNNKYSLSSEPSPAITSFTPASGGIGSTVTLTGTNFDSTPGNNSVSFNGTTALVTASTATSITTKVPAGATSGVLSVTVAGKTGSSATNFTVLSKTVTTSDSLALVAFYNSTNGSSWNNKSNWLTGSVNTWYGVTVTSNRVTDLTIPFNGMSGSLPAKIGDLTALTALQLYNNQIGGSLPTELGNLTNLLYLNIDGNRFTGSIPPSLGNLTKLVDFRLFNNQLSGTLPPELGNLTDLNLLDFVSNQLTGTIPTEYGNLVKLTYFSVANNKLTGAVPSSFANLTKLVVLLLNANQFTDLPNLSGITTLSNFNVSTNNLTFEDIEPNLSKLNVYSPQRNIPGIIDQQVPLGQTLTLTYNVGGTANVYQWAKDGVNIPGATSATYTKANVTAADKGSYVLKITNTLATALTLTTNATNVNQEQNALNFRGSSANQVVIPNTASLNPTTELTLEAWVNLPNPNDNQKIVGKTNFNGYVMAVANGGIYNEIWNAGNGTANGIIAGTILPNKWTHLAVTFKSGASMVSYINGVQVNSTPVGPGPIDANSNNLLIGNSYGYFATGSIDEVSVWNVARTPAQIQADMLGNLTPNPNLLAYYDFNAGTAGGTNAGLNTVQDKSNNGNTGTLSGFALTGATSNWASGFQLPPAPTISSLSVLSGSPGTSVIITGTNFSTVPVENIVKFNGIAAVVTASTANTLTTSVPTNAPTGPITVTLASNTATSTDSFFVIPPTFANGQNATLVLGQPNFTSSTPGTSTTSINATGAAAVDPTTGKVFVVDAGNHRILRFSAANASINGSAAEAVIGQPDFTTATPGLSQSKFNVPWTITVDNAGNLWVADFNNNRVLRFANASALSNGANATSVLGQPDFTSNLGGVQADRVNAPAGVAVDNLGNLYVGQRGSNRVSRFNDAANLANGSAATAVFGQPSFTSSGGAISQSGFNRPNGVATDNLGNLWVADELNGRVMRFANAATAVSGANAASVLGKANFTTGGQPAAAQNTITCPLSVSADNKGTVYVADWCASRILVYPTAATLANGANASFVLGQPNFTSAGGVLSASGLTNPGVTATAVDVAGNLWVGDNRNRALRFNGPAPAIASFSPTSGSAGTVVTITGANFSGVIANNIVNFNGVPATVTASSETSITATIPTGATSGKVTITIGGQTGTSFSDFTVASPSPIITSFTPTSGSAGSEVTVTGTNFDPIPTNNVVKFNGTTAVVTASTATSITTTVPTGVTTGPITVTVGGQTATSSGNFTAGKTAQTITFAALSAKTFGDAAFTLAATASSSLAVIYASSNAAVATVSGNTVTIVGAGTATITASQPGDATFDAAVDVPQTLTVNKAAQTITFAALAAKTFGDAAFTLAATSSSSLTVSYVSSNTGVATVTGNTVTIVGAGTTTITATQAGNTNYNAATDVPQTLTVNKAAQTITFAALAPKTFGNAAFTLAATASSGLAVAYASSNTAVATVSGNTITIVGAGSTSITASQLGNASYNAATEVTQAITVNKANQTITFAAFPSKSYGDAPFSISATASSNLPVTLANGNPLVATLAGNTITIVGAGNSLITGSQAGNANFNAAPNATQLLKIKGNFVSDSLALVRLYNNTNGAGWTNKTNWLSTTIDKWFGVTLSGQGVAAVNLPNNKLTGPVPEGIAFMQALKTLNLSSNAITSIPDFSDNQVITALNVSNNKLEFGSLEPNKSLVGTTVAFNYTNQADIGTPASSLVDFGTDQTVTAQTGGTNNYVWKRNGAIVANADAKSYVIKAIGRANMGEYVCEITNSSIPGLTIKTAPNKILATALLSGKLFASAGNAANKGIMKLLKKTTVGGYDTTATKAINTDGTYKLEKIVLDDYQLNGFVDTLSYKGALPTWYTNTIYWEEANIIAVEGNVDNLNITSNYKPVSPPKGKGIIKGTVFDLDNSGRLDKEKRVKGCAASVRKVEQVGRTEAEKLTLVAYVFSNENGEFTLPELPTGDYRLNIQYPGYPMDVNSFINISIAEGLKSLVVVAAEVDKGQIKVKKLVVTGDIDRDEYAADVFPNPSADYIQLRFEAPSEARTVLLTDLTGKVITLQTAAAIESKIDVTALSTGIYLLEIKEKDQVVKTLRVMKE